MPRTTSTMTPEDRVFLCVRHGSYVVFKVHAPMVRSFALLHVGFRSAFSLFSNFPFSLFLLMGGGVSERNHSSLVPGTFKLSADCDLLILTKDTETHVQH